MSVTVIVPTYNEAPNIAELVARVAAVSDAATTELLFVDDSNDDTPFVITRVAAQSEIPVRLIHREHPVGGLSGAVLEGFADSSAEWCLVMDGDLQHPPEMIPVLLATGDETGADIVVASRHIGSGSDGGLSSWLRRLVSNGSITITRAMFPLRLRNCTDPMTGFFAVRRQSLDLEAIRARGFKILLEVLARHNLKVAEEPFIFGERLAGQSKAHVRQGLQFLTQLAALRFGRMSRFAIIGGVGAVANLLIMAALVSLGVNYVFASIVAAFATILGNFFAQERFVFHDLRDEGRGFYRRFALSIGFNSIEAALRLPLLYLLVELTPLTSVVAQAATLAAAFLLRFVFHSRIIYRPRRTSAPAPLLANPAPLPAWDGSRIDSAQD